MDDHDDAVNLFGSDLDAQRLSRQTRTLAELLERLTTDHREVSLACAERVLLPAVRAAGPSTIVLADNFSCRYQIIDAGTAGARTTWPRC